MQRLNANRNGYQATSDSLVRGWDARRLWRLSIVLCLVVATCDALIGSRLILIGLLVVGPCCALLTGRWIPTGLTGALALALGTLLGIPDQIFATYAHYTFLAAVGVVTASTTLCAAYLQRHRTRVAEAHKLSRGAAGASSGTGAATVSLQPELTTNLGGLEKEVERFPQVGAGVVDGVARAGDVDFWTP